MAIRIFTCDQCGHKMRLAGARCGVCGAGKRLWQRPVLLLGLICVAAGAVLAFVLLPPVE